MENKFNELLELVNNLKEENISHDELGQSMGFHEGEQVKNDFCNYLSSIINDYKLHIKDFPKKTIEKVFEVIKKAIKNFETRVKDIERIIEKGVNQPQYPNQRTASIAEMKNRYDDIETALHIYESKLFFQKFKNLQTDHSSLTDKETELKKLTKSVKDKESEISKILGTVRDKMIAKGIEETAGTFDKLRSNHLKRENWWFFASAVFSLLLIAIIISFFFSSFQFTSTNDMIIYFLKKVAIVSILVVLFKISLNRNNLERNLRILYDHRATVLEQYKIFEGAIGEDLPAKNQFRLEIAKYIFSDPDSGYNKESKNDNLNVNPIINLAEKFTGK